MNMSVQCLTGLCSGATDKYTHTICS